MKEISHICRICGDEVSIFSHFFKFHKIKESDYWLKYFPKFSKTGKPIPFKNREQYLESEFVDKNDLKQWIKENPIFAKDYILSFLKERFESNKNTYLPSQVESKTLLIPSVQYIHKKICNYNTLIKSGLKQRFDYDVTELNFVKSLSKYTIIKDSREQKGLDILKKEERAALKFGDYSCSRNPFNVFIERKSLADLISTLGCNYERFEREIIRAKDSGAYLFIICEASFNDLAGFKHGKKFRAKVSFGPDFIFHRIRELMQKYLNIQFVFSGSRQNSASLIELIYKSKENPKNYDWQYLIDSKIVVLE